MRKGINPGTRGRKYRRYAGLILISIWAAFWIFFAIASFFTEPFSQATLFNVITFSVILAASAVITWRWETAGGIILVLESLLIFIVYPILFSDLPLSTVLLVLATMALPPLITGCLALVNRYWAKTPGAAG
jgi:hypothetical protein